VKGKIVTRTNDRDTNILGAMGKGRRKAKTAISNVPKELQMKQEGVNYLEVTRSLKGREKKDRGKELAHLKKKIAM